MFPIIVFYDSGVTMAERLAVIRGLKETQHLFGSEIFYYGNKPWQFGKYQSADQLVNSAYKNNAGQINATLILNRLEEVAKSWLEPCAIVLITSFDLYANGLKWCFGLARPSERITVQSVHRYRGLVDSVASFCIRRTLRHELGHIYGCLADKNRTNTVDKFSIHCSNPHCSMRQAMNKSELIAMQADEDDTRCFCPQCMQEIAKFKMEYARANTAKTWQTIRVG